MLYNERVEFGLNNFVEEGYFENSQLKIGRKSLSSQHCEYIYLPDEDPII